MATDERSPRQVADELSKVYGRKLDQVAYIPALPLVAKLRLSELTGDPTYAKEVHEIVKPFLAGEKSPVPKSGSEQAGHLIFAELATHSEGKDRQRWVALCRVAADQIFGKDGQPLSIMPYHNEMSDAVFMAGPILAATGKLTGERKYFDAAAMHFASMRKLCLRADGIYRHSPLCEAAWGRGNGFPALGLAWALSEWPDDHPAKGGLIAELQKHLTALKPHQDAKTGCWHQVIDHPESYDEYSCTCMIGWAMRRGISRGWLEKAQFQPHVDRAWQAIRERTSADGKLVNVCTGTGKQKTLQDYFDRPAINGRDDRGGAMGLLFMSELIAAGSIPAAVKSDDLFVAKPLTAESAFTAGIEGPNCDRAGNLYAVNYEKQGTIGRVTPEGKAAVFVELPNGSIGNGIVFGKAGTMYVADYKNHNVLAIDTATKAVRVFAHEPTMNQPNDLAIGPDGTIWASDPNWGKNTGQIWRIDTSGKITLAANDLGTTNGIEVSPDGKTLYVNESVQRGVWAFPIAADGTLGERKLVKQFPDHGFDGMRCDCDGNLYITRYGEGTVVKLSPAGEILKTIDVLGASPSNLCFGGPDGRTVYVTEVQHRRLVSFRVDQPGLAWQRWQTGKP
ncbi:MAG: SMP-30/gluconolactonase/LRE family protein [Pirellulaceae bacterium]|nr:SMP-30/gluconolactonase/LRE family protein [Pirellulaceae bacterium]